MLRHIYLRSVLCIALLASVALIQSCDGDEKEGSADVQLLSFGPSVQRGGELKFVGTNLKKVTAVVLPVNVEVPASMFKSHTATEITLDVPDEAVQGLVTLRTPEGDIVSKTELSILEPITITAVSATQVRPGDILTFTGTYLNLISEVIFASGKSVTEFESQSRTTLQVKVPVDAQTGPISFLDSEPEPNKMTSTGDLIVTLPMITSFSPATIKAGNEITITGTNLDLATEVIFGGVKIVGKTNFKSQDAQTIVLNVPDDAQKGKIRLTAASTVKTESSENLQLVISNVASVTPAPAKTGGTITVTGTDLDLVSSVEFGGGKTGTIQTPRTATQITVTVPADAKTGDIIFKTRNNESVNKGSLTMVKPTITTFTPASVNTVDGPSITITGTDLDIVKEVVFNGGYKATVTGATPTQIVIPVVPGSTTGGFKLVANNGDEVASATALTIVPHVPNIPTVPAQAFVGSYLTITGTNMDVPAQIIFPGNIVANNFGAKTSTSITVFVPETVPAGEGKLKFVTFKNEIYETPTIAFKFPGAEPIVDPLLIINNFDETGHDLGWDNWNGNVELGNNAAIGISGKYLHGTNASANSWTWIWGCNHDQLPKKSVAKATHVLKLDVKITKPIAASANFEMALGGNRISLGNLGGSTPGGGWVTLTYDLSTFGSLPATIPTAGDWGINLGSGTGIDITGLYIDNIRFQAK